MFRINLLFILTMFLSACGVKAAPTQTAEIPPTEAPIVIPTNDVVLPKQPVGVGLAPGSEVVQSSTADSQVSQDYFVPPTIPDAKRVFGGEAPVPEQISAEVAAFKAEADKILAEVESDCVVDDGSLRTVYHEGSVPGVDNLNNWFFTYEGTFEGEPVVCWATKISDGKMGEFPIYYEQGSKRVMSLADGVMWQRTPKGTTADLAGTTPVLISKTEFIVPEGLTGSDIHNEAKWTALEAAPVVESAPVANPFTPDQMARLDETGYTYNASGELVNAYGNVAISNRDGKWVDGGGNEFSFDSFKIIETNGVTFEDLPLNIVSFDVGGEQRFSLPSGESAKPIDLSSGRDLVDKNAKTNPTAYSWGTYTELTFDQIPVITQEDVDSGLLFFSRENNLRPWSSDVIVPVWKYMSGNTEAGVWYLTQYKTGSFEIGSHNNNTIAN